MTTTTNIKELYEAFLGHEARNLKFNRVAVRGDQFLASSGLAVVIGPACEGIDAIENDKLWSRADDLPLDRSLYQSQPIEIPDLDESPCRRCDGSGQTMEKACAECGGSGVLDCECCGGDADCHECDGQGVVAGVVGVDEEARCLACSGRGFHWEPVSVGPQKFSSWYLSPIKKFNGKLYPKEGAKKSDVAYIEFPNGVVGLVCPVVSR